jgi:8-oxo-dGTP pyrophosphatase MutT (NUDIX family)
MSNETNDKPGAQKLGWRIEQTRKPYESKRFDLREDRLRVPGKDEPATYAYAERAAGVLIVPVTSEGEILLISQYRYPVDAWCLETPAGSTGDTGDMPLPEVVRKELREEIGAEAGEIERIGGFFGAPAYSTERCEIFIAWDARLAQEPEPEPTEEIKLRRVPAAEALRLARDGSVQNAACALALLRCEASLRQRGFV